MKIGIIKEIKNNENRVSLTPEDAAQLASAGHTILLQSNAGMGSGFSDADYVQAGTKVVTAEEAWSADLVIKVKEPQIEEYHFLTGQILFTFLHLAGVDKTLTKVLLESNTTAIAYEAVEDSQGRLPLLAPMSAIAGSMAVTMGNFFLAGMTHGKGVLLSQILGKSHGKVVIIGDGIVGQHAARVATSLGADVILFGLDHTREAWIHQHISSAIHYQVSSPERIQKAIQHADLIIGAVLIRGKKAPFVITEKMVKTLAKGTVVVDVSIDQGGCIETSHPTSHADPVFEKHGVIHYCVTNMPGAYPRTSTMALTHVTLPYVLKLANHELKALEMDAGFKKGLNTYNGELLNL